MTKLIAGAAALAVSSLAVLAAAVPAHAEDCGRVTIAEMSWNSAATLAHMEKIVLSEGYGCDAELVPGDTLPTITSMTEKREPDIAPEIWPNAHKAVIGKAVEDGDIVIATKTLQDGGQEGWFVPSYMVEAHPELATIDGLRAHADLFPDQEEPGKGRFYTCPAGWQCQIVNANLMTAYGLDDAFTQFDPGSGPGLAGAIAKAYERREPVFAYYFGPTAILGKYDLVRVGGMEHDPDTWTCVTSRDCADPQPNMYPPSDVLTLAVAAFADRAPEAYGFVSSVSIPNDVLNAVLAWQEDHQATGEGAAMHFLKTYPEIWTPWVPAEVADKVKAAL
ncbi:ABC transporter substrate-binding protein [Roseospira marina]|uniref:ABC transporter substrate-binding protein n=1 Tax=Roseospira marina TaxID=140057 RepID=A0A5M6IBH7_9PROT|nr:ABC transporter substrate-binding protein [Roseospira marina]KAA5605591.1 ABC transporter substrate-binding protein [Roseospira marina]MBB4313342.1 glycine betaine/proline transport system substrate-binding protein [Roseospira marina]MBB5085917.1 glycine betaine/proline transport system substrate-binding protein [Roseospira marina]